MEQIRINELLTRIAGGDETAFAALYAETRKDIFAFALSILENYHDAEDVMQEVFLKVKLQAGACKDFDNASGWLFRVARNTAIDFIRKKKEYAMDGDFVPDKITGNKDNSIAEYSIFISELFDELKEEERQIVVLHLISDLTHKTIAKILELPLTTVKWRYRRAIMHLQKISVKKEWEYEGF